MKVFKGLSLTDQKIMFENLFVWDDENGDIPNRKDFKKWVLDFFESPVHINNYISDMEYDIELSDGDAYFSETDESYRRQIEFLKQFKNKNNMKKGIQYSHYCGLELTELVSAIDLCMDLVDENRKESEDWGKYALQMVSKLRDKIAELDKLNGMDY